MTLRVLHMDWTGNGPQYFLRDPEKGGYNPKERVIDVPEVLMARYLRLESEGADCAARTVLMREIVSIPTYKPPDEKGFTPTPQRHYVPDSLRRGEIPE